MKSAKHKEGLESTGISEPSSKVGLAGPEPDPELLDLFAEPDPGSQIQPVLTIHIEDYLEALEDPEIQATLQRAEDRRPDIDFSVAGRPGQFRERCSASDAE